MFHACKNKPRYINFNSLVFFQKPRIELNGIKEIPEYNFSDTSHVKMEQLNGTHNAAFDTSAS